MAAPVTPRVTRNGKTLSARMWAFLEESYRAAGIDPAKYLHVGQGSFRADDPVPASGTTHNGGGAADLRTWNLPDDVQANLCERLVRELRKRGGCAWYRDQAHGGFDPHIHVILRDEPGLSSSAAWQCAEYAAKRDGLTRGGPDYGPRPTVVPFVYPPRTVSKVKVTGSGRLSASQIAKRVGTSTSRILRLNGWLLLRRAKRGDMVRIPADVPVVRLDSTGF
jgi:hypothetical protein